MNTDLVILNFFDVAKSVYFFQQNLLTFGKNAKIF